MSPAINPTQLTIKDFPRVSGDEPRSMASTLVVGDFPRVSGDEPEPPTLVKPSSAFSPRERG